MEFTKRLDLRRFSFFIGFLGISLYILFRDPVVSGVSFLFTLLFLFLSLPYTIYVTDFAIIKKNSFGKKSNLLKWDQIKEIDEKEINFWDSPSKKIYNILFFGWFVSMLFGVKYRQLVITDEDLAELRFNECDFADYENLKNEIFSKARKKIVV